MTDDPNNVTPPDGEKRPPKHQPTPTSEINTRPLKSPYTMSDEDILIEVEPEEPEMAGGETPPEEAAPDVVYLIKVQEAGEDVDTAILPKPAAPETEPVADSPEEEVETASVAAVSPDDALLRHTPQITALSRAIARFPNAPANYVLRGEALLEVRAWREAATDFQTALNWIAAAVDSADWGYIYQALAERARRGLSQAMRWLT